uniref:Coiled-coil domain-containing protein 80 n=1 Tax=Callorhinchus milii TaxID=7868 RepID=A0A4W3H002_CALMI
RIIIVIVLLVTLPSPVFVQIITAPGRETEHHVRQRDLYLEHVCELALRKVSVVSILGSISNSNLSVETYQLEKEAPFRSVSTDSLSPALPAQLREHYGMTFNEFFMVLTDYDMKIKVRG